MSNPVTITPQFSMAQVLKPFPGFEEAYAGVAGTVPIAFPGTLDPQAGKAGYASELMAGVATPMGCRVRILIPQTLAAYTPVADYQYQVMWRIRNAQDEKDGITEDRPRPGYHLPFPEPGRSDAASRRYFLPCATDTVIYEQAEPSALSPGVMNMRAQRYVQLVETPALPLVPGGGNGVWQQGVYENAATNSNPGGPSYSILELDAMGDEMAIWAFKADTGVPWDFATTDAAFSNTYGTNNGTLPLNPNVGIIVMVGTASP